MSKEKVYISGPMTGIKDFNYPKFNATEKELLEDEFEVFNPASIKGNENWAWEDYMKRCVIALPTCDFVYLLKGWESSRGANVEVNLANVLGIPILMEGES